MEHMNPLCRLNAGPFPPIGTSWLPLCYFIKVGVQRVDSRKLVTRAVICVCVAIHE
jgi:hypothetical protein